MRLGVYQLASRARKQTEKANRSEMLDVNEGYVIGLLTEVEERLPALQREIEQGRVRAAAVDAELSSLLRRLDGSKLALGDAEGRGAKTAQVITDGNLKISSLHQEVAGIKRRAEDIKTEMERVSPGAIQQRLRRERAKFLVQIEDRDKQIEALRKQVEEARAGLTKAEGDAEAERERTRVIIRELDALQSQLPRPQLFAELFATSIGRAHCRYVLDQKTDASGAEWSREVRAAIKHMQTLHAELRAGKYRLDKNSDLVGGRATESAEAVYAAVALGDQALALELFASITDPTLFFHNIFNVMRTWCVGLWLQQRMGELTELVRVHQLEGGLAGAYAQAFAALLARDNAAFLRALRVLVRDEWAQAQNPQLVRAAGVVSVGGLALVRLGRAAGFKVPSPAPTVPEPLVAAAVARRRA